MRLRQGLKNSAQLAAISRTPPIAAQHQAAKPKLIHRRRQWAVGQGCFHSGVLGAANSASLPGGGLRYAYDCGSLHKLALHQAIDAYHAATGGGPIDFLFLSHLHADHVNGIAALCTIGVDTVVLPHLNAIDRLISFAHAASEADEIDVAFLRRLTADPIATIAADLNPRQIIVVRRGEGDAPGPGAEAPAADGPRDQGGEDRGELKWTLTAGAFTGRIDSGTQEVGGSAEARVFEVADDAAFAMHLGSYKREWLLAPYVDVEVSLARAAFIKVAADAFGLTSDDFEAKAQDAAWLLKAVTDHQDLLVQAYGGKEALNVTSLCLYSGPPAPDLGQWNAHLGQLHSSEPRTSRVAWLGTGDADLKKPSRLEAFVKHYSAKLPLVRTLLLPHHGSEHNFHPDLLTATDPMVVVAAAKSAKWRHPGSGVVHGAAKLGLPLWNVTDQAPSAISETVLLL